MLQSIMQFSSRGLSRTVALSAAKFLINLFSPVAYLFELYPFLPKDKIFPFHTILKGDFRSSYYISSELPWKGKIQAFWVV